MEKMTAFFESLCFECLPITDSSRIKRLHPDRAGEFTAPYLQRYLHHHRSIHHTLTISPTKGAEVTSFWIPGDRSGART